MTRIPKRLLKPRRRWTYRDKQFLRENCGIMKDEDIAIKLNRSIKSVREKRVEMGLKKKGGRGIIDLRD